MIQDLDQQILAKLEEEIVWLRQVTIDTQMKMMAMQLAIRDIAVEAGLPSDILVRRTEGILASLQIQAFLRGVYLASQPQEQKPAYGGASIFH